MTQCPTHITNHPESLMDYFLIALKVLMVTTREQSVFICLLVNKMNFFFFFLLLEVYHEFEHCYFKFYQVGEVNLIVICFACSFCLYEYHEYGIKLVQP